MNEDQIKKEASDRYMPLWNKSKEVWTSNEMVERSINAFTAGGIFVLEKNNPPLGQWQCCPKCNGQGIVAKPPHVPGDVFEWSSTSVTHQCDVCNGNKIIQKPIIHNS